MIHIKDRRLAAILLPAALILFLGFGTADAATLPAPAGYSSSQLIFQDQFSSSTLDSSKWNGYMADQGGIWTQYNALPTPYTSIGSVGGYNAEYGDPYPAAYSIDTTGNHTVTGTDGLQLIATPSSKFSPNYTWASGYVTSEGKFAIPATGGYVQFSAKMPDSRYGAWAGLWFLDGSVEIDLQESGTCNNCQGLAQANRMLAMNVHNGGQQVLVDTGEDLSAAYHTYGMEYNPGKWIKMYLDGVLEQTWTSNVPTGAYEIIISNTMAQNASTWHTVADPVNHPGPFELDVSDVQVYSLPGSQTTPVNSTTTAFTLTSPASGSSVSGTFPVTGTTGSTWMNVVGYNSSGTKVCPDTTPSSGMFTLNCNASLLQSGSNTITIAAFSTPAGQSGYTETTLPLMINVQSAQNPAPTVALQASPASLAQGNAATLAWSSTNAVSCIGTGFSTAGATEGSVSVVPATTTNYSVTCAGSGGSSTQSATVTVNPTSPTPSLPVINSFAANPATITSGQSSALSWSVTGATSLSVNGTSIGGSSLSVAPTVTTAYVLTATDAAGSVTQTATVNVQASSAAPPANSAAFALTTPASGSTVSGTFSVSGTAGSTWLNVAGYSMSGTKICSDTAPAGGTFILSCDSTALQNGSNTLNIDAFSTPAGQSGYIETTLPLMVNVENTGATPPVSTPITQLEQALAALIQQIASLVPEMNAAGAPVPAAVTTMLENYQGTADAFAPAATSNAPAFTTDLQLGSTGGQVTLLQEYLNTHGYPIAASGPGSPGEETAYFGEATQAALIRFQIAAGITPANGYFGPKTRAYIAAH